jgi:Protein of unknown function (DUF998)
MSVGWIQVANFILCDVLFVACAAGMRQVMRGTQGSTWGPLRVGIFGLGMLGAGMFTADPSLGYPPGTPETSNAISTHRLASKHAHGPSDGTCS